LGFKFTDLDRKLAEIKARPKSAIEPLTPPKTTEPFAFDSDNGRDPFTSLEKSVATVEPEETPDNGIKPDPSRVKEELEEYPLDNLKMVGTIKDSTLWGLVLANGTVYKVKIGNYIGQNDGKITEISNTEIRFTEIIPDKTADKEKPRWNEQPASLKLVATE
jgi:type IV pilus assembly protein PilP